MQPNRHDGSCHNQRIVEVFCVREPLDPLKVLLQSGNYQDFNATFVQCRCAPGEIHLCCRALPQANETIFTSLIQPSV